MYSLESMYKYAKMSLLEHQIERYNKVKEECDDFTNRFPNSPFIEKVKDYKQLSSNEIESTQNLINKIKDEQAKETNKS
ncbi:MAG: hypothetical protein DI598_08390 [Pseudopedobacter saltans]|uniref:Uncharacterized protein n=1 Tax=Pseudopedobacter saltans TaxID=151895 RepID=A0A2W5F4N3_9SPHI|nr:MAG: hypothetical protein DI598_08390 [Pseudopedobacter saltans]